jgi:hypothetical protein
MHRNSKVCVMLNQPGRSARVMQARTGQSLKAASFALRIAKCDEAVQTWMLRIYNKFLRLSM